jgi:addiction module RelB/DinJ family antitoxin
MKIMINIKADKEIKEGAVRVAQEMGLPLSTIINAFLKQFIRDRKVTFEAPLIPTPKLEKILRKADADIKAGKNLSPAFKNPEDAIEWLDSKNKKWS